MLASSPLRFPPPTAQLRSYFTEERMAGDPGTQMRGRLADSRWVRPSNGEVITEQPVANGTLAQLSQIRHGPLTIRLNMWHARLILILHQTLQTGGSEGSQMQVFPPYHEG